MAPRPQIGAYVVFVLSTSSYLHPPPLLPLEPDEEEVVNDGEEMEIGIGIGMRMGYAGEKKTKNKIGRAGRVGRVGRAG